MSGSGSQTLSFFVDKRSNMEHMLFLSVSYQNKRRKIFCARLAIQLLHRSGTSRFRRLHQAKQVNAVAHHVKHVLI